MRRAVIFLAVLLALSLAACGGKEYKGSEHTHDKWKVEWDNCIWDVTHQRQDDGAYAVVEVPEDKLEPLADQCMQKKGYHLKTKEDEPKKSGWLWW